MGSVPVSRQFPAGCLAQSHVLPQAAGLCLTLCVWRCVCLFVALCVYVWLLCRTDGALAELGIKSVSDLAKCETHLPCTQFTVSTQGR